jgi:hypothetical protein
MEQEALELAHCAAIITTGGSVNAFLQLKHLPLDACPGERAPSIDRVIVFIACLLRLMPLPSTLPGLRQHIPWLSQGPWLLRPSPSCLACGGHLLPGSVGMLGCGRAREELRRSWRLFVVVLRVARFAGVLREATWIMGQCVQPFPMPFWAKPIIHVGLLFITTIP